MGLRSGIVRIHLPEKSSIKHDPAVDRNLDGISILHVECCTSAVTMVSSEYGDEFSAAFNKLGFHPLFVRMVPRRKCVQRADALFPTEFHDGKVDRCFPKDLAVVIQIPILHFVVLQPSACLLLFAGIVYDAPWFFGTKASRVGYRVWREECPKQIVGDLIILQKREKALSREMVGYFDKVDQEVQVLEAGSVVSSASIYVALIRFQFMEVVVQQVSFNLGSS